MKVDPGSSSGTKFLHTEIDSLFTSDYAVLPLLQTTGVEGFPTTGFRIPFSGGNFQTRSLHYGLPGPRSDIPSEASTFELIATPSTCHSTEEPVLNELVVGIVEKSIDEVVGVCSNDSYHAYGRNLLEAATL
jgi:hypothetical protein